VLRAFRAELDLSEATADLHNSSYTVQLPFLKGAVYDCQIDWGDGSPPQKFEHNPNTQPADGAAVGQEVCTLKILQI
jgi:hypothetical protein